MTYNSEIAEKLNGSSDWVNIEKFCLQVLVMLSAHGEVEILT